MPTLHDTYRGYEPDILEMIAEQWGIEQEINWRNKPALQIAEIVNDRHLYQEITAALPPSAAEAYRHLAQESGRVAREIFARSYGNIREMGEAVREKERPDRNPASDAEHLFYRGLVGLAFFEKDKEAKEYFYIPDEFLAFTETSQASGSKPELPPIEKANIQQVKAARQSNLLELLALRLAILRGKIPQEEYSGIIADAAFPFVDALLEENDVFASGHQLTTGKLKHLLLADPNQLIPALFGSWMKSESINDLKMVPALAFEGQWINDPLKPRLAVIETIRHLPPNVWFSVDDLEQWFYSSKPHFLRVGGEFEQWFIKERGADQFLRGFTTWPLVDGRLIRYLIQGPLQWFGITHTGEIANPEKQDLFYKTDLAEGLLNGHPISIPGDEPDQAIIHKNGEIYLPRRSNREMQYQIARFCSWSGENEKYYIFRLTAKAIRRAETQNITIPQIKVILKKYGQEPIPKNIFFALDQWKKYGPQIQIEEHIVVRFKDAALLNKLSSSGMNQYIIETLNPTTIIINKKELRKFENALGETGYLAENHSQYNQ